MHNRKNILALIVFLSLYLFSIAEPGICSPFISFPGARAKAMAGAFTAVADDPSSVWYNPAGFATKKIDCTLEAAQATTIDEAQGPLENDQLSLFFGAVINLDWFKLIDLKTGLLFYSPYTAKYWAYDDAERQTAWGHVHETYQILGIPVAKSFFDDKLKLGLTLEWVLLDIGDSDINYRDQWGWADRYQPDNDSTNGLSGSIGVQGTVFEDKELSYNIKAGAVYRFKTSTDIGKEALNNEYDQGVESIFFDKPRSFDIGLAFEKSFATKENIYLSLQYGSTDWGGASGGNENFKYNKISLGAEYEVTKTLLFIKKTAVRAGYYQSTASGSSSIWSWPDVTGITFGAGIAFGDVSDENKDYFQLDGSVELRALENDDDYDESASLMTIALSWLF